jgi:type IV pilus assembly protein PilC
MATATKFEYQVRDKAGKTINGKLEAPSQQAVAAKLREMGYAPVSITEAKESALSKELSIPGFGEKVKTEDLAVFSRQFATMINSGVSLIRALNILAEQTENKKLAEIITEIRNDVEEGQALSDSVAKHPTVPEALRRDGAAGETAGMLDRSCSASPTPWRRTSRCGARSSRR